MNHPPFLIKCKIPKSTDESLSLKNISPPRHHTMFFTPAGSTIELQTSPSPYATLTYPYPARDITAKYRQCRYKCCNQEEVPRWSMILKNQLRERRSDFCNTSSSTSEKFSSRHNFQEKGNIPDMQVREQLESETTTTSSGKRTRTAFTPIQLLVLETAFEKNHYIVGMERKQLAVYLKLTEQQVKVWYQNRRTKYKKNIQQNFS